MALSDSVIDALPSPCFVVDLKLLEDNLRLLDGVQRRSGCKILLALKGFSMYSTFPLVRKYLHGVCASSPNEARLGREEFNREVHVGAPAYSDKDMREILTYADCIVFNSFSQWRKHKAAAAHKQCGIRLNPEYSEVGVELYNPCAKYSRLGVTAAQFKPDELDGISGLHFHALCEQGSDALKNAVAAVEKKFGAFIKGMRWFNFGGGHHITKPGYDIDLLCDTIKRFQDKYQVQVYLEPGEAVALNTGFLVATVLDLIQNEVAIAVLDTSAETHMPDVLAMPYTPKIVGAGKVGDHPHRYRLGGLTCLAGDCIGDYSFEKPLHVGSKVVFTDMAHYSMVKTTTFNGVNLPSIALTDSRTGDTRVVRTFGYEDFKSRL